jgi:hypothetical protein
VAVSRAREPNLPQQHVPTTRLPPIDATRLNLRFPPGPRHMETQHPLVPLPQCTRKHKLQRALQRPLLSQPTVRSHAKQRSHRKTQNAHRRTVQSPHRRRTARRPPIVHGSRGTLESSSPALAGNKRRRKRPSLQSHPRPFPTPRPQLPIPRNVSFSNSPGHHRITSHYRQPVHVRLRLQHPHRRRLFPRRELHNRRRRRHQHRQPRAHRQERHFLRHR